MNLVNVIKRFKKLKESFPNIGIQSNKQKQHKIIIVPTDTVDCCKVYQNKVFVLPRWNPALEDLIDDTYRIVVMEEEEIE